MSNTHSQTDKEEQHVFKMISHKQSFQMQNQHESDHPEKSLEEMTLSLGEQTDEIV